MILRHFLHFEPAREPWMRIMHLLLTGPDRVAAEWAFWGLSDEQQEVEEAEEATIREVRLGKDVVIKLFVSFADAWERWSYPEFNVWIGDGKLMRTDQKKDFPATYHIETFLPAVAAYSSDRVTIYRVPGSAPNEPVMSKN